MSSGSDDEDGVLLGSKGAYRVPIPYGETKLGEAPLGVEVSHHAAHEGQTRSAVVRLLCSSRSLICAAVRGRGHRRSVGESEDMDSTPHARAGKQRAFVVKGQRADLSSARSSPHLLQLLPAQCVEDPDDGSPLRSCSKTRPIQGERHAAKRRIVRLHVERLVHLHQLQPHMTSVTRWTGQHCVVGARAETADALWVGDCVDLEDRSEIGELVHENLEFENDNDFVSSQTDGFDLMTKAQLPDVLAPLIVPNDNFVGRKLAVFLRADKSKYVAPKEHLDVPDTAVQLARDGLLEGSTVENLEAVCEPHSEAALILVEADEQYTIDRIPRQVNAT
mmetsp:Transcript_1202/g.2585  ORF Transcript_1202/g.2585 Transcript_1202/m.2585 type:complete len:334 (-) Transcript_1202:217-1218(-)